MSNYIEYEDTVAFHPGYYIEEIVEESGLSHKDFAQRLGTSAKNLSKLLRGQQRLSLDIAVKLSRMLGTSVQYWLNLQSAYDAVVAEHSTDEEDAREREIFSHIDYKYFKNNFGLPELRRKIDDQIKKVREFLGISSLTLLAQEDFAVSYRSEKNELTESNIVKANIMVQIAMNKALEQEDVKEYNEEKFKQVIEYALSLTTEHTTFYPLLKEAFSEAGVSLIILPNLSGSKINGATKKIGKSIMLMVNDRRSYADIFWFTLFHEIGHIINRDFGISFESESGEQETKADEFAADQLIPPEKYKEFAAKKVFTEQSIRSFSKDIGRDPGIVVGRLQNDGYVEYTDRRLNALRNKYKVFIA